MSGAGVAEFIAYWEQEGEAYVRRGDYAWMAGLVPGQRVLEIGCGVGYATAALAARGLDVLAEVIKHTRVLVLTTFDEDTEMMKSLSLGAHGYLLKSATPDSIVHAVVEINRGKNVYDTVAMEAVRRYIAFHTLGWEALSLLKKNFPKVAEEYYALHPY